MISEAETDVLAEAALWHVRLKRGGDADWDAFILWLEGDPARQDAYDQVEASHAAMTADAFPTVAHAAANDDAEESLTPEQIPSSRRRRGSQAANAQHLHETPAFAGVTRNDDPTPAAWWRTRWAGGLAVAAAFVLVMIATLPLLLAPRDLYDVATGAGERRQVALGDGSTAELNGATRLRLDRDDPRYAELVAGEATFVVRHDESDPFVVQAGGHELRDVGTSFNVVTEGGALSLEVIEGAVLFDPDGAAVRVDAGRTLRLASAAAAPALASADPQMMAGWRSGRLNYAAAPLDRVAGDLARSLGVAIAVDPALRAQSFTGTIRIQRDAGATVTDLAATLGLSARRDDSGWTIEPAANAAR